MLIEVIEVGHPHVADRPGKTDDEVLREQVFGIGRINEHVREGGCRISHILRTRQELQKPDYRVVGAGPLLVLVRLAWIEGIH